MNSKKIFPCCVLLLFLTGNVYSASRYKPGLGLQTILGIGSPVGFIGIEGKLAVSYFDFAVGVGEGLTGTQISTMVRYFPDKYNTFHIGMGPSFGFHEGTAEVKFKDPDTGKVHTDIKVEFDDRYYWWNTEMGIDFFSKPKEREGLFFNLTVGGAYLYKADYDTISESYDGMDLTDLLLVPITSFALSIQRPVIKENRLLPYGSIALGYHF